MLRKIRVALAIASISILTLLFLDFTGTIHLYFGWIAKMQFIPAILALNVFAILFLGVTTLLFGRIYCSVICPLGIFQDIISWISGKTKKNRFSYSKPITWLRYLMLAVTLVAIIIGVSCIVTLFDPYGAYGRIASNLFAPVYQKVNNVLAYFSERAGIYAFYETEIWIKSLSAFVVTVITFIAIAFLSWRNGRIYCNSICPVGTFLGLLSRISIFRPVIDYEKCISCNLCERNCKSSCINVKEKTIDYSRCVVCMDCVDLCKVNAIRYVSYYNKVSYNSVKKVSGKNEAKTSKNGNSRRAFFSTVGLLTASGILKAQEKVAEGGLAVIEDKKIPKRNTPIKPAGANSLRNFTSHCTACGLCVSVCPNGVLKPSSGLKNFMQPEMSYEIGYCRPECVKCSEVCPTGAITKISAVEKSAIKIGTAVWIRENCVVLTDDVNCDNCARHCPTGAIQMHLLEPDNKKSLKIPVVDAERCIGCGACENLCPSRPFSAIYVEGIENHRIV